MPERDFRLQPADAGCGQLQGGLRDLADDTLSDASGPQLASSPCGGHDRGRPAAGARRGEEDCVARFYRCCEPPTAPGVPGNEGAAELHHHHHNRQWPPTPRGQIHHPHHHHASCDPAAAPYATPTPSSSGRGGGYPAASPSPAACSRMLSVSPTPKRRHPRSSGDRFILDRDCNMDLPGAYALHCLPSCDKSAKRKVTDEEESGEIRTAVIKREMFGSPSSTPVKGRPVARRLFQAETARALQLESPRTSDPLDDPCSEAYNPSPVSLWSQRTVLRPRRAERKFSTSPYKVLDAPDLQDDFYLNLVDWSPGNILAVGLNCSVYLWSAESGSVVNLCNLGPDQITSVNWKARGEQLAVGTSTGLVHIYDALRRKRVRVMQGHTQRVGNLAWNNDILTSGSRDRHIIHRDTRAAQAPITTLTAHRQEICGLKWDVAHNKLASGGNDNKLIVWDGVRTDPLHLFDQHTAAVKAIAWSPHQKGILASGGGTADKHIRLWNTTVGTALSAHDTGSQVCNLAWSKNGNELVSTHGYSQNEVVVWKAQKMAQVATLTGHSSRVLYLAMSPDGQTIVTGAGDETLRFWQVFPEAKRGQKSSGFPRPGMLR